MQDKSWFVSKSIWGGILVILGVAAKGFATNEINPQDISYLGVGLGLIGIRFKLSED